MRILIAFGLCGCASLSVADRLILAPLGTKIPLGTARLEHMFDQADHGRFRSSLGFGVSESIDAELTYEEHQGRGKVLSYDVGYNIVPSITNLTPGISVGIRDGTGKTSDGRFYYAAMTQKIGLDGRYNGDTPAEVTLGVAFGDRHGAYTAVMLPFRESFRLLAEFDTHRVSAGLEFRPVSQVWVRWIHRQEQSLWSLTLVKKL